LAAPEKEATSADVDGGKKVLVMGAAGNLVVQLAKTAGCHVVVERNASWARP